MPRKDGRVHTTETNESLDKDDLIPAPKMENPILYPSTGRVTPSQHSKGNACVEIQTKRKCTDLYCCFWIIITWLIMALISYSALQNGNPLQLVVPRDYLGNYCGIDNVATSNTTQAAYKNQTGKPYLYYFDPLLLTERPYICVSSCPNITRLTATANTTVCIYDKTPSDDAKAMEYSSAGVCTSFTYASSPILDKCIPYDRNSTIFESKNVDTGEILNAGKNLIAQSFTDFKKAMPAFWIAILMTIVLNFAWFYLLREFPRFMPWGTLAVINSALIIVTAWLFFYWRSLNELLNNSLNPEYKPAGFAPFILKVGGANRNLSFMTKREVDIILYNACGSAIITVGCLVASISVFRRMKNAIKMLKIATDVCAKMPLIQLFPLFSTAIAVGFIAQFIYIGMYLITPESYPQPFTLPGKVVIQSPATDVIILILHLIGFLWAISFALGIAQVTIAGAVAFWYWKFDKTQPLGSPVYTSLSRVCKYHLGSIALGSVVIAFAELIRLLFSELTVLSKAVKKSKFFAFSAACVDSCLSSVTKLNRILNKNAYVYIAITGKSFPDSSSIATDVLSRNTSKLVKIDQVCYFILFVVKVLISGIVTVCILHYLSGIPTQPGYIRNPYSIVIYTGLTSFFLSSIFLSIHEITIDTVILCALEDLEMNDGTADHPYYMPEELHSIMGVQSSVRDVV